MNNFRRWAMPVVALLMVASLVGAPREGNAKPTSRLVPGDPAPTQEMGPPDVPPVPGPLISCRVWLSAALLARGCQVDLVMVSRVSKRSSDTRFVTCASRVVVNP